MSDAAPFEFIAFMGDRQVGAGDLRQVAADAWQTLQTHGVAPLVLDAATSRIVELDLRGERADVLARLPAVEETPKRGPGRPKLGVVAREVTLMPRHWEWLATQPGGASVALRKLVEEARRSRAGEDRKRAAQDGAFRFLSATAGNHAGYEDAVRALFAGDAERFAEHTHGWPGDLRDHARRLADRAFNQES